MKADNSRNPAGFPVPYDWHEDEDEDVVAEHVFHEAAARVAHPSDPARVKDAGGVHWYTTNNQSDGKEGSDWDSNLLPADFGADPGSTSTWIGGHPAHAPPPPAGAGAPQGGDMAGKGSAFHKDT